ncbi:unnamed protein product [Linum trigynum]|uniref:Uncharacterized protein n=1 Tax=Linum trigynum TaxID=586398 RepID=A0AAV2CUD9_9ROSI
MNKGRRRSLPPSRIVAPPSINYGRFLAVKPVVPSRAPPVCTVVVIQPPRAPKLTAISVQAFVAVKNRRVHHSSSSYS